MRRWLPFVLVLLLALRGLVGDAMAGQMLAQQFPASQAGAAVAVSPGMPAGHDCDSHGHEQAPNADPQPGGEAQAPEDCPTCASCQACSTLAMWASPSVAPALPPVRTQPRQPSSAYPSAEPALTFKPPRA